MQAVAHFIDTFVPEHYDLFLDLNRSNKTFSGKVTITGEAKETRISLSPKGFDHRNCTSRRAGLCLYSQ